MSIRQGDNHLFTKTVTEEADTAIISLTYINDMGEEIPIVEAATPTYEGDTKTYTYPYLFPLTVSPGSYRFTWTLTTDETPIITTENILLEPALLITTSEIRSNAAQKGIDLTTYTNTELHQQILTAQNYIETETGGIWDNQEQTFDTYDFEGKIIILPHYPILYVTTVKVNNKTLDDTDYYVDKKDGIIHLKTPITTPTPVHVTYNASYNPPHPIAQSICIDMILSNTKYDSLDVSMVQSLKEGDVSVTYKNNTTSTSHTGTGGNWLDINTRLSTLKRYSRPRMI